MSKNIIICADGTGNSGGTGEVTNVWRLYEAVSLHDAKQEQVAKHDDGVGTQSFKFLRILGLGVGLGLSENLTELYHYLIRRYDEGDRIYLFGFSRGAFTVRTLANILYYCGIADRHDENGELRLPEELNELSTRAVAAHQSRNWQDPDDPQSDAFQFRRKYGLRHEGAPEGELSDYEKNLRGRFPIEFVGVWDTVDAVGLPFDEMTQYCLRQLEQRTLVSRLLRFEKCFGHVLRRSGQTYRDGWEDDGGHILDYRSEQDSDSGNSASRRSNTEPFIRRICHAMAIDDERYTFHPTLYLESQPGVTRAGTSIEQVWFPGVHANVGGGYPKDGLAYVSLNWMMYQAHRAGLRFNSETWRAYRLADSDGPLYDSRAGGGRFYRYRTRDLGQISQDAGLRKPTLHPSVLSRLKSRVQDYAPTGIPAEYNIAPAPELSEAANESAGNGQSGEGEEPRLVPERMRIQKHARELIWWRRVLYYAFVLWFVFWLGINFMSATVLEKLASVVRWFDRLDIGNLTNVWWWFAGLAAAFAAIFQAALRGAGRSSKGKAVHRIRREFALTSLRNLCLGTLGILALHKPLTSLLDWSLPALLAPLVVLLKLSPVVLLVLFYGSYLLLRSSKALIGSIGTTQSAAWDASLLRKEPLDDVAERGWLIRRFYRIAEKARGHQRDGKMLTWKWKHAPRFVFWIVNAVLLVGILISVASVAVRFRVAGERFAETSDSLNALASVFPHDRISFNELEELSFDTQKSVTSEQPLTKGRWYLMLAGPTRWAESGADNSDGNGSPDYGQLPYQLSGHLPDDGQPGSAVTAEIWGWKDNSIPATPEGNVESEMSLGTKLIMNLFAPCRRSATLPWFQLMGHMESAPDRLIPVGSSVIFRTPVDGTLTLYVNDVPGFYCNNSGTAHIRIYECEVAQSADGEQADNAE